MTALANPDELTRLRQQCVDAQVKLASLLEQRAAAMDVAGLMPTPSEVEKAQARLEVAEALLRAHERMASK